VSVYEPLDNLLNAIGNTTMSPLTLSCKFKENISRAFKQHEAFIKIKIDVFELNAMIIELTFDIREEN
jgi:hypothetical protein